MMSLGNAVGALGPAVSDAWDAAPSIGPAGAEPPPVKNGEHERRIQLRAFDLWNRLLDGGALPTIGNFEPSGYPSLSPFGVLIDFTSPLGEPVIAFLGESLARECGVSLAEVGRVSDLPERSLLARIAEHYLATLDSPAPIGFEAECVNQREQTILYRGILLPFTRSRSAIDFVFGVISWKEAAHAMPDERSGCEPDGQGARTDSREHEAPPGDPAPMAERLEPATPYPARALAAPGAAKPVEAAGRVMPGAIAPTGTLLGAGPRSLACPV